MRRGEGSREVGFVVKGVEGGGGGGKADIEELRGEWVGVWMRGIGLGDVVREVGEGRLREEERGRTMWMGTGDEGT